MRKVVDVLLAVAMFLPVGLVATLVQAAGAVPGDISGDIYNVAGSGIPPGNHLFFGDGGPATSAQLYLPSGEAFDHHGNLLIADSIHNIVRLVAESPTNPGYLCDNAACTGTTGTTPNWVKGNIYTIAGNGIAGYKGDGGRASSPADIAELSDPTAVTVDATGNVLIADEANDVVRVVGVSASNPGYFCSQSALCSSPGTWVPGDIYTIAGTGVAGYGGDGDQATTTVPALSGQLDFPEGVAVDADGNVLIADYNNNAVRVVAVGANPGYVLAPDCPGVCTWSKGRIYTITGKGPGAPGYTNVDFPAVIAELDGPDGVTVDADGNVLISDATNDAVRVIAVGANPGYPLPVDVHWASANIYSLAGTGPNGPLGTPNYGGDGNPAFAGKLAGPDGVAVDHAGNVLIADQYNNRLRLVAVSSTNPGYQLGPDVFWFPGDIYTIAGTGVAGFHGNGGLAISAMLNEPVGVALDSTGNVYITDYGNNFVRLIAVAPPGTTCTSAKGTATFNPKLPIFTSKTTVKSALTVTETLAGCTGGGVTSGIAKTLYRASVGLNCTTFAATSTKTIMTGTQTVTWNTKTTSSMSIAVQASGTKGHFALTTTGTVIAGRFKGQKVTGGLSLTPPHGGCTKLPMGATTVNSSKSNSSY